MTDVIRNVLDTMSGSYMSRWKLDREQESAWYDGLRGFSPDVLRKATIEARVDFPDWPPTLMEFRRYCIANKRQGDEDHQVDIIEKWNKWARDHGMAQKKPNESVEEFRARLVWQFECRRPRDIAGDRRPLTSAELSKVVAENREANAAMKWTP